MACGIDSGFVYPSDPNNDSSLNAVAVIGGIRVSWSYPTVNPQSVTHTKVFKGTSAAFGSSSQVANTGGDSYFDGAVAGGTTYYYWIQIVSYNGTVNATIGPASATATSWADQVMNGIAGNFAGISGAILNSDLAASLQSSITQIETNRNSILSEGVIYSALFDGVQLDLAALGLDMTSTNALIVAESNTRQSGLDAQATLITGVIAQNVTNAAAVVTEMNARVTATDALATSISAVVAITDANLAAVVAETLARTNADSAIAGTVTTVEASVTVLDGQMTTAEADIDSLETFEAAQPAVVEAAIQDFNVAQVGYCQLATGDISTNAAHQNRTDCEDAGHTWLELKALATAIKTIQIDDGVGGTSTIEVFAQAVDTRQTAVEGDVTTAQGDITAAEGDITTAQGDITTAQADIGGLEAQYTVKLQTTADGVSIVGGFGLASTTSGASASISAGFNVDEFWIADLSDTVEALGVIKPEFVPFAVSGGVVYIKTAFIENLTVGTVKFADDSISSLNQTTYTTDYVFTPYSGYSTDPPAFSVDIPTIGNSSGQVVAHISVEMNYQFRRDSTYSTLAYHENVMYIKYRYRVASPAGSWSGWTTVAFGQFFTTNALSGASYWGGYCANSQQYTLSENYDYEFKLDDATLGVLTDSSSSNHYLSGTVTRHVWSSQVFAK